MTPGKPTLDDLAEIENAVSAALRARQTSTLPIIGFGEISVALGWPADEPSFVCKRMPPCTVAEYHDYERQVTNYMAALAAADLQVVDTSVIAVERDEERIVYLVQPLLAKDTLGDKVLARDEPDPDHPMLQAIGDTIKLATDRLSVDGQVTNWSWDGSALTLIDIGTPFMWDERGETFDLDPFLKMLPAPVRPLVKRDMVSLLTRWQTPRGVAVDLVANLFRIDEERWVDATVSAMNRILEPADPIDRDEAHAVYAEDLKTWPRLKQLQRAQRAWQTSVRRRPYDFFIQDSFAGTTE